MTKKRVMILSDSPMLTTGYSNQAQYLGNLLVENGHDVFYLAHTYIGQNLVPPIKFEDGRQLKFNIIGQGMTQYFQDVMSQYLKLYKIDVFIILLDTFMLYGKDGWFLKIDTSPAKTIFWFPSDGGGGMPLNCEQILRKVDIPVAMSKFGKEQVKKVHNINTLYIPHMVDLTNYKKYDNEKRIMLKRTWGLEGKFVIGVVARNQLRKMLDRTIKTMAIYAKQNPNAILLLHMDPNDPAQGFPITSLIQRYGLENRVRFTGTKYYHGFNFNQMSDVYNLMDVFLLTTSGEGFGIPLIEAQACGVPVLATNYTTTKELVIDSKAGLGIDLAGVEPDENPDVHGNEILDGTITGSWSVERGICSIKDAVKKLDYMYNNPDKREQFAQNGIKNVKENYDLNVVGKKWLKLVEKLGDEY